MWEFSISVAVLNSGIAPTVPPDVVTVEDPGGGADLGLGPAVCPTKATGTIIS